METVKSLLHVILVYAIPFFPYIRSFITAFFSQHAFFRPLEAPIEAMLIAEAKDLGLTELAPVIDELFVVPPVPHEE